MAKIGKISAKILLVLKEMSKASGELIVTRHDLNNFLNCRMTGFDQKNIKRRVKFLEDQNYFSTKKCSGALSIEFTEKGNKALIEAEIASRKIDHVYRFLSFDIPSDQNIKRDQFRRLIKKLGFVQVQQSLWVINKDATKAVELYMRELEIEKNVIYITSLASDVDGILDKLFKK